ncbi:MAG: LamG domain-containing protein [Verrucomicrobiae bacterium]|nr:LamG domain-containing protein [Verrucomicrobiae bacterium]
MKPNRFSARTIRVLTGLALALAATSSARGAELPKGLVLYLNFNEVDSAGVTADRSGHRLNGRVYNVKWATGKMGGAYEFTGANSFVTVPNSPFLNVSQGTFAVWFKTSKSDAVWRRILDKRSDRGYAMCIAGESKGGDTKGKLAFIANGRYFCLSDSVVTDGSWHHAVATCDGVNLKLYVDGALQKQVVPMPGGILPNANDLTVGLNRSNPSPQEQGQSFEGMIDEVMIFNRALTAEEIKSLSSSPSGGTAAKKGKDGKTVTKAQVAQQLNRLKSLLDAGLITQEFYEKKVEEAKATVTEQ